MVAVFATFGLALEAFHGYNARFYVDVNNEMRRLMWTLAHAHGVLVGLVHLGFAATLRLVPGGRSTALASACLFLASLLLPGGFFLGGLVIHQGDPGIGVFLSPVGGVALVTATAMTTLGIVRSSR